MFSLFFPCDHFSTEEGELSCLSTPTTAHIFIEPEYAGHNLYKIGEILNNLPDLKPCMFSTLPGNCENEANFIQYNKNSPPCGKTQWLIYPIANQTQ